VRILSGSYGAALTLQYLAYHRAFDAVGAKDKAKLVEVLSMNLAELSTSVKNLTQDGCSSSDPATLQHRSAVQVGDMDEGM